MDAQSFIETPELYLSGRCQSNKEQLGHVETSADCLKESNIGLQVGVNLIADVMRFSH